MTHPPHHDAEAPSAWVVRFGPLVRSPCAVLDLASGAGRHSRWFARRGCEVLAIDRDAALLEPLRQTPGVSVLRADLERDAWPIPGRTFDAIVVTNYLHRPLFANIAAAVAPDGVLLYETFAIGNELFGKPSNPDFLLRPHELLHAFSGTTNIVAFEQGEVERNSGRAVVQRLAAVGRARRWPPRLDAE